MQDFTHMYVRRANNFDSYSPYRIFMEFGKGCFFVD